MRMLNSVCRILLPAALCFGALAAAELAAAPVAQYHFAGLSQLTGQAGLPKLKQIWVLPSTVAFRNCVLQQASAALARSLAGQSKSGADGAALLQPLLEDVLQCESAGVFGGPTNAPIEFVLAIRFDNRPERAQFWQDNLTRLLAAPPQKFEIEGFSGTQWNGVRPWWLVAGQGWLVIGTGNSLAGAQTEYLSNLRKQGRPVAALKENWLEGEADWAQLASWLPLDAVPMKLARTRIACSTKKESISASVHVTYPDSFSWSSQTWQIPTNLIKEPLISFTAGQNVMPFLKPIPQLAQLPINPLSGQFFVWAEGDFPFATSGAAPVDHATNVLKEIGAKAPALFNPTLKQLQKGELKWMGDRTGLAWVDLKLFSPELSTVKDGSREYLFAQLFPNPVSPRSKSVPKELLGQVEGRKDLVYYDWELTGKRLEQWFLLAQILPVLPQPAAVPLPTPSQKGTQKAPQKRQRSPRSIMEQWLIGLEPHLQNTATEITRSGRNELTIVRKSDIGFSGLELVVLSDWLTRPSQSKPASNAGLGK